MSASHDEIRVLLGGYVLGGLSSTDRRTFEDHLATCPECREDLARSAPLPGLLRRAPHADTTLPPETVQAAPDSLERLLDQVGRTRTIDRRRRRTSWFLAAAVAILGGVGLTVAPNMMDGGSPPGTTVAFSAAANHTVSGQATMTPKPWGTSLTVSLSDLPPSDGPFVLQVTSDDGTVEQAAMWGNTPAATAEVTGASSLDTADIETVAVLDGAGDMVASTDGT